MANDQATPGGPDLTQGIALAELADGGKLVGHVGDEEVLLVRRGNDIFAVGAHCTHYHGPLGDGLVVGDTVRCPWHHACFDLRTGEALRSPALSPVACWNVEQRDKKIFIAGKRERDPLSSTYPVTLDRSAAPRAVVIVGGGAAGSAAAEMLRRSSYDGPVTIVDEDDGS